MVMSFPISSSDVPLYVGMSLLTASLLAILWIVPKWQVSRLRLTIRDVKARTELEDNLRKTFAQLFGGVAVLAAGAFAYYQSQLSIRASRDFLISQQVSKGFEQLGSTVAATRLGGVYALEGVMNASEQYRWTIIEALSAVVRDESPISDHEDKPSSVVVRTIVTVLGRRTESPLELEHPIDLSHSNLRGASLSGANLSSADLTAVNLAGANLYSAKLSSARLSNSSLSGATLIFADLSGTDLSAANISSASLSFAKLTDGILVSARMRGANLSLSDLTRANLESAELIDADLTSAKLFPANLRNANLTRAKLRSLQSIEADMTGATLSGADLTGTNLGKSNLSRANLSGAILNDADLSKTDVTGADLSNACGNSKTKLPPEVIIRPCPAEVTIKP
jgi:uncharacterized protein YjbI with pentapeptide repeats